MSLSVIGQRQLAASTALGWLRRNACARLFRCQTVGARTHGLAFQWLFPSSSHWSCWQQLKEITKTKVCVCFSHKLFVKVWDSNVNAQEGTQGFTHNILWGCRKADPEHFLETSCLVFWILTKANEIQHRPRTCMTWWCLHFWMQNWVWPLVNQRKKQPRVHCLCATNLSRIDAHTYCDKIAWIEARYDCGLWVKSCITQIWYDPFGLLYGNHGLRRSMPHFIFSQIWAVRMQIFYFWVQSPHRRKQICIVIRVGILTWLVPPTPPLPLDLPLPSAAWLTAVDLTLLQTAKLPLCWFVLCVSHFAFLGDFRSGTVSVTTIF